MAQWLPDMLLNRSPKIALKNTQNPPLYSILKLTFLGIFENENSCFSQFARYFVFKKFHLMAQKAS